LSAWLVIVVLLSFVPLAFSFSHKALVVEHIARYGKQSHSKAGYAIQRKPYDAKEIAAMQREYTAYKLLAKRSIVVSGVFYNLVFVGIKL
jgi:hypothetical protein